jgi:hypothetical protein
MKVVEILCPEKQHLFKRNCPFASMVAKWINDSVGDIQCKHFLARVFVIDKSMDVRDIAQVAFFNVSDEFCLVDKLSKVVPIKENQALMTFFLNR